MCFLTKVFKTIQIKFWICCKTKDSLKEGNFEKPLIVYDIYWVKHMCLHMSKNSSYSVLSLITHFWRKLKENKEDIFK